MIGERRASRNPPTYLKGAAGGPPNPNGPRGARHYKRASARRDAPPGCARVPVSTTPEAEAYMWTEALKKLEPLTYKGVELVMNSRFDTFFDEAGAVADIKYTRSMDALSRRVRDENMARQKAYYDRALAEEQAQAGPPPRLSPAREQEHGCNYLRRAWSDPGRIEADMRREAEGRDFDTLVGIGMSGALVVPWLARALGKHWAIVRKGNDTSHSTALIEGTMGTRYVFVDDLVSSGSTFKHVLATIRHAYRCDGMQPPECIGAFLYTNRPENQWQGLGSREIGRAMVADRRVGNLG